MQRKQVLTVALIASIAVIGVYFQFRSHAATSIVTAEAESGTLTAGATALSDTTASAGKAVQFAVPTPTPAPTPPPPTGSVLPTGQGQANGPSGTWNLQLNDDFNGTALDGTVWSTGWFGVGSTVPVQTQETACYAPSQVTVSGGSLHLKSIQQNSTCSKGTNPHPYTSGAVNSKTKKEFSYGYFEARLKLDANSSGQVYNWPAWWLDGTGTWPSTGELDIMEGLSGGPKSTWHGPVNAGSGFKLGAMPAGTDYSQYHTYAAEWASGIVTTYYDGVKVGSYASATGVTSAKQFLILGEQMSPTGQYGGPILAPSEMAVDWIRVWQR